MKKIYSSGNFAMGLFGQFIVGIISLVIIGGLSQHHLLFIFVAFIPLAFITMFEQSQVDVENFRYRRSMLYFGFINFGRWHGIFDDCYFRIEPYSESKSMSAGPIEFGTATQRFVAVFLRDPKRQEKIIIKKGDLKEMENLVNQMNAEMNLRVVNYITRNRK